MKGIVVITGGASGIGAACCREFAAGGAQVVVVDRDIERAVALATELDGRAFPADVADEHSVEARAEEIEAAVGPVEVLVNSAGIIQPPLRPTELSMALFDEITRVDQRGTYVACVAFGKAMLRRRRGSIVNIASIAGMRSMPLHAYGPAKAAVIAMTECLAAEWGPAQVRVNCVSPGYTRTPALRAAIDKGERDVSALAGNSALGRLVEPDEIARVVAFLASPAASAMTGANVPVDCGWLVAPTWRTYGGLREPGTV
jgi:NAD(P)-dependent dehydrogenase (short-subunit alcohol dehydrogenase family)